MKTQRWMDLEPHEIFKPNVIEKVFLIPYAIEEKVLLRSIFIRKIGKKKVSCKGYLINQSLVPRFKVITN